jgi:hypothetical protein
MYGIMPDLSSLRVFGCLSYDSTLPTNRHKFNLRARKCAFLGYKVGMKGFILLDVNTHDIFVSRNVKFFDMVFPFLDLSNPQIHTEIYIDQSKIDNVAKESAHIPILDSDPEDLHASEDESVADHVSLDDESMSNFVSTPIAITNVPSSSTNEIIDIPHSSLESSRKSSRVTQPPVHLKDYVCDSNTVSCHYLIEKYMPLSNLSPSHQAYIMSLSS